MLQNQFLWAQTPLFNANTTVTPYNGGFRAGMNYGFYNGFNQTQQTTLAATVGAQTVRPGLFESFTETWGYDSELPFYRLCDSLGQRDNTLIVGFPSDVHRDATFYCPTQQSTLFANMYEPIWDNNNGTPINEQNYYANYIYKLVTRYKSHIKFWEIWNEPGFDYTQNRGWLNRGQPGNWWENNPDPCDYKLRAPIQHYVRLLRISYEVIKSIDSTAYVCASGLGYPSFLDAICRNTDNPSNGIVATSFPLKGGAYFDCVGFHSYPHFDGSLRVWNNSTQSWDYKRHSDAAAQSVPNTKRAYEDVLESYGYGTLFPRKNWIITEANVPRRTFGDFMGSEISQRNFMLKGMAQCIKNGISQFHVYKLGEETTIPSATYEFNLMGIFEKLDARHQLRQTPTESGIAYKTFTQMIAAKKFSFDAAKTVQMRIPANADGLALRDSSGNYTYMLWAKTTNDRSETANATYSFPNASNPSNLRKVEWDYATTQRDTFIGSQNIALTATPIFLTEQSFLVENSVICTGLTTRFRAVNSLSNSTLLWTFEGGQPQTSTLSNPQIAFLQPGNFTVTLAIRDSLTGSLRRRETMNITVNRPPTASFLANVQNTWVNFQQTSQNLSPLSTNLTGNTWRWDFGDSTTSTLFNPQKVYFHSATFPVRLTVQNACGTHTTLQNVSVVAPSAPIGSRTAENAPPQYPTVFRAGANLNFAQGWQDEQLADIAVGIHAKTMRFALPDYFTTFWGENIRAQAVQHYENIGLNLTLNIGFPHQTHRDTARYCATNPSELFKNLYENIWKRNNNGVWVVNDANDFARYVHRLTQSYAGKVKYWEIWNAPGVDVSGNKGWKPRGAEDNWWDNNPEPCDLGIHAPIQHMVRMMRIAYEVIKSVDSNAVVVFSGAGYPSFLDAICRNTDNPENGSVKPNYPRKGGAYFDAVSFQSFPHGDGSLAFWDANINGFRYERNSDVAANGIVNSKNSLQDVLKNYGFNDTLKPAKRFLISELNIPRKPYPSLFSGEDAQKNFILKSYIKSATNGILELNIKNLSEYNTPQNATSPDETMGLFQKLGTMPYMQTRNIEGIAFATISETLFGTTFDSVRTRNLNLRNKQRGAAFRKPNGRYVYALWAAVEGDLVEYARDTAAILLPPSIPTVFKRDWQFSNTRQQVLVNPNQIFLTETPIFILEDTTNILYPTARFAALDTTRGCPNLTVRFENRSLNDTTQFWQFENGIPATSTSRNPTVRFPNSGKFRVSLTVQNANGSNTFGATNFITIDSLPVANFAAAQQVADSFSVNLTNLTRHTFGAIWDFGDGTPLDYRFAPPPHRYARRDTFHIRLVAYTNCGSDTIRKRIDLRPMMVATENLFNDPTFGCKLSPNPTHDVLTIDLQSNELTAQTPINYTVIDVTGKVLLQTVEIGNKATIDVSNLASGAYLLRLSAGKWQIFKKLIKI
jgi:PKD repeat protein